MLNDFKAFIMRGNVLDMAVGVIIGAAFGKIVTSLVDDVVMPPIGLLIGGIDFSNLFVSLNGKAYTTLAEATAAGAPVIKYGVFANQILQFLVVAFAVFMLIQQVSRFMPKAPEAPTSTKACPFCCSSININATRCACCTAELKALATV